MNHFTKLMTLAAALLLSVPAMARISPGDRVEDLSALKTGDRVFVQGMWAVGNSTTPMEQSHWLSTYFPSREADSIVVKVATTVGTEACFELEEAGRTLDLRRADGTTETAKGFYIKSVRGGKYLTKNNDDQGTAYESSTTLTEAKTTVWYFAKAVTMGADPDNPDGDQINIAPENASVLCCQSDDGTVLYINNNYSVNGSFTERMASLVDSPTWHEIDYALPDDNSIEAALQDIDDLYSVAYDKYQTLAVGTNPGFCKEEYATALDVAMANSQDDSQLSTDEAAQACYQALLDAYLKIDEEGLYPITDGYYYLINCQNDWGALTEGGKQVALSARDNIIWWNLVDTTSANYIWKITALANGKYSMQNLGTSQYADNGSNAGNVYTIDGESSNNVELVPLATPASFGVKMTSTAASDVSSNYLYIHCKGHGDPEATGAAACLWVPRPQEYSGWYLIAVPDERVKRLTPEDEQVKREREARQLVDSLNTIISTVKAAITSDLAYDKSNATDVTPTLEEAQANNFDEFNSNAGMSLEHGYSYGSDGTGYQALIDNDISTWFHTTYGTQPAWSDYNPDGTHPDYAYATTKHNLSIRLTQPVSSAFYVWTERQGTYHDTPQKINVLVSNDGQAWTQVATAYDLYNMPDPRGGDVQVGPFDFGGQYQYLRFESYGSERGAFFNLSELRVLTGVTYASSCQLANLPSEIRNNLFSAYYNASEQAQDNSADNIDDLKSAISSLTVAYDQFLAAFVDPSALRNALTAGHNFLGNFMTSDGKMLGTYTEDADTTALSTAVAEGEALLASVGFTADRVESLAKAINDQIEALDAYLVKPDPNKWYRFQFGTEEEMTDLNFAEDCHGLVDRVMTVTQGFDSESASIKLYDSADDVTYGSAWLQSVPAEDADITPELSYFRFIAVGDSGYVVQNKASGMFIPALARSTNTALSMSPGVFTVKYFGHGFVTLGSRSLFDGSTANDNLHFSAATNAGTWAQAYIVGWTEGMRSKSAFHIMEAEGADELVGAFRISGIRATVYPEPATVTEGATTYTAIGKAVEDDGTTYIAFNPVETIPAGTPAIIVPEDLESPYSMSLGSSFVTKVDNSNFPAIIGGLTSVEIPRGAAIMLRSAESDSLYWQPISTTGRYTGNMGIYLDVNSIVRMPSVSADDAQLLVIVRNYNDKDALNGISAVKTAKAGKHEIYTIDGVKLPATDPQQLSRGIYIINGKKVLVP